MSGFNIDIDYYRHANPDLGSLTDEELRSHYELHGIAEGRASSDLALREGLIALLKQEPSVLEIGPFCNPVVRGKHVRYFDVFNTKDLKARAKAEGYKYSRAPKIDYVSPNGDLSVINETFTAAVSAHCIEHQPDIIRHLKQVGRLLEPGGRYYLIVPHKSYCFDYFIAESTIAQMIGAHLEGRTAHRLASIIEHRALTTHNDPIRHWNGDHSDAAYEATIVARARPAIAEYNAAGDGYIDVHAWQFSPASFTTTLGQLHQLGLSPFTVMAAFETPKPRNEFTAILTLA